MKAQDIVNALKTRKGQHVTATWTRNLKTRADVAVVVTKQTTAHVRAGIDYANLASVKRDVESGERGEVQSLPWGEWTQFPFIISHKGQDYVRLYPATFANLKPVVEYRIGGKLASVEEVKPLCLASEFRESGEAPACFTLKADSILSVGE